VADLGIEPLTEAFKFLGSDQMTGPGSEMLFVEKYGETLYREAGFTPTAELINGRLAVRPLPDSFGFCEVVAFVWLSLFWFFCVRE
jgi:hypothetical protein